ncbi:PREDICTED: chaoptin-like, partial [Priapulus caudatus]|uniref:Chaoptin-like n=1 Tax=Priapulus caudatus TaxID=37621 RepID=A0ABM1EA08_PRICU
LSAAGPALADLNLRANLLRDVPRLDVANATNLISVNLQSNHIASVPARAFSAAAYLRGLYLGYNLIGTVDPRAFAGLSRLEELSLFGNRLEWLPADLLGELTSLAYLYLHGNALLELPVGLLATQTGLIELNVAENALVDVDDDAFSSLGQLEKLYANDNQIHSLSDQLFANLTSLKTLDLSGNKVRELTAGALRWLVSLHNLKMRHNDLHVVDADAFSSLAELWELDLTDNHIGELPASLLTANKALLRLRLGRNKIESVHETLLSGLLRLRSVDLSHNRLADVPENLFNGLSRLESLNLNNNELTSFAVGLFNRIGKANSLAHLNLGANALLRVPPRAFVNLGDLVYLNLADNKLSLLPPDAFEGLGKLQYLGLADNKLVSLADGLFEPLGSLRCLYLDGNGLESLSPLTTRGLTNIELLDLSNNELLSFPLEALILLTSQQKPLKRLSLARNLIAELPVDSERLYVRELDLSHNTIGRVERDFFYDVGYSLESLDLSHNVIADIPTSAFANLRKLTRVSLRGNRVTRLFEHSRVEYLDAAQNNFTTFSLVDLTRLPRLGQLDLSGNRISQFLSTTVRLASLTRLDLSDNHIVGVPLLYPTNERENRLPNLRSLNLSRNHISSLEGARGAAVSGLKELDLSHNELYAVPRHVWAEPTMSLRDVNLSHNQIEALDDDSFANLSSVESLRIAYLPNLRRVSAGFARALRNLVTLRFHDLPMLPRFTIDYVALLAGKPRLRDLAIEIKNSTLADQLAGVMPQLSSLYVTGRHLTEITDTAFQNFSAKLTKQEDTKSQEVRLTITGTSVRLLVAPLFPYATSEQSIYIDLDHNQLETFSQEALDVLRFNRILYISIEGSRFFCDCYHRWFIYWMQKFSRRRYNAYLDDHQTILAGLQGSGACVDGGVKILDDHYMSFQHVLEASTCFDEAGQDRYSIVDFNISTLQCHYTRPPVADKHLTAYILGGAIGGSGVLALIAIVVVCAWCCCCRRGASTRKSTEEASYDNNAYTITQPNGGVVDNGHRGGEGVSATNGRADETAPKFRYTTHL